MASSSPSRVSIEKGKAICSGNPNFLPLLPTTNPQPALMYSSNVLLDQRLTIPAPAPAPVDHEEQDHHDHEAVVVEEGRVYSCSFCRSNFTSSQALGGHQNAHKHERAQARRRQFEADVLLPYYHNKYNVVYNPNIMSSNRSLGVRMDSMIHKPWAAPPPPRSIPLSPRTMDELHHYYYQLYAGAAAGKFTPAAAAARDNLSHRLMDPYPHPDPVGFASYAGGSSGGINNLGHNDWGQTVGGAHTQYVPQVQEDMSDVDANGIDLSLKL